jgi:flagellar basal body-associated protein FliL
VIVATRSIKDTTIALEETLTGTFKVITGEEARKAKEEFRKRQEQAKLEEQLSAKEEEIRKELSAYLSEARAEDLTGKTGFAESREEESEEAGAGEEDQPGEPEDSEE